MAKEINISLSPLKELTDYLCTVFVGREQEVVAALTALAAGEPVFFCGPPGTAKTALIEELAKCLNARYFYYLLTRFTEPDELLGPLDVAALREGKYQRITTNRLPDSDVVFLDEVFKAGSAVLNILLDIILNRRVMNGTQYIQLPLLALYTASNEVTSDAELMAFYDRLLIRSFVKYVSDDMLDDLLYRGVLVDTGALQQERPQLSRDYVVQLQRFVSLRAQVIAMNPTLRAKVIDAVTALKGKGIILSDRRKVKLVKVVAALATVLGEKEPSPGTLGATLLLVAPHDEEEVKKVNEVVIEKKLTPFDPTKYHALIEEGLRLAEQALKKVSDQSLTLRDISELKEMRGQLASIYDSIPRNILTFSVRSKLSASIRAIDEVLKAITG